MKEHATAKKVYVAAPLFSEAEKEFNRLVKKKLGAYVTVHLPQEDGELVVDLVDSGLSPEEAFAAVFESDIRAMVSSDILLIILDGRTVDEGAAFELGFAYARGLQCIGLQTDPRRLLTYGNNPMLSRSISRLFADVDGLVEWIASQNPEQAANCINVEMAEFLVPDVSRQRLDESECQQPRKEDGCGE